MNVKQLQDQGLIAFETVAGSQAYGTNTPTSDEDIRGIFVLPQEAFLGLTEPAKQVGDDKHDITYYELRRFFELASDCNPNIIELLWMPDECIRVKTPLMEELLRNRDLFLSTKAYHTFSGYAYSQIKRAKGQNKWINNPQPETAPDKLDFCWYVPFYTGQMIALIYKEMIEDFIQDDNFPMRPLPIRDTAVNLSDCRVASLEHFPNAYRLYRDGNGVFRGSNQQLVTESIPKEHEYTKLIGLLCFNEQAYDRVHKDWTNYWDWMKARNEHRWVAQERGEIDYDAKNMMHCLRLLWSGKSIMEGNGPIVRFEGTKLAILKDIRAGSYSYEYLMDMVENEMASLEAMKDESTLPRKVNAKAIEDLYRKLSTGDFQ